MHAAVKQLSLREVAVSPVGVLSPEAAEAGCEQHVTDMVANVSALEASAVAAEPQGVPGGVGRAGEVPLCRYAVPAEERGSDKPQGAFGERRSAVPGGTRLPRPGIGGHSDAGGQRPGELSLRPSQPPRLSSDLFVELDGCRRAYLSTADGVERALVQAGSPSWGWSRPPRAEPAASCAETGAMTPQLELSAATAADRLARSPAQWPSLVLSTAGGLRRSRPVSARH